MIDIGVDLGTTSTRVAVRGKGIVVNESSYAAIDKETRQPVAYGQAARELSGRSPAHILVQRPLANDRSHESNLIVGLLNYVIGTACRRAGISQPTVMVGIKVGTSQTERAYLYDAIQSAGAHEGFLIEEPVAAAIGAGLPIQEMRGSMIVDIGGGTTQAAVFSSGKIVSSSSSRVAGDQMDKDITQYMKSRHDLLIGERSAENAKIKGGSAYTLPEEVTHTLRGRDLVTGLPNAVDVSSIELREALAGSVSIIVDTIRDALRETPPELVAGVKNSGICLAGGGSQLKGLADCIQADINVRAWAVEDCSGYLARGLEQILNAGEEFNDLFLKANSFSARQGL